MRQIERLALRDTLDHVEQHDIAEALERGEMGERSADVAGANERDFLAGMGGVGHGNVRPFELAGRDPAELARIRVPR